MSRQAAATFGHRLVVLLLFPVLMAIAPIVKASETGREQRDLVDQARMTLDNFTADPNMTWFRDHVKDAKGVFIMPQFLKAAFFVGGAGGSGVFLAKDEKTGEWSEPAFFTMGAGSFGFQSHPSPGTVSGACWCSEG